MSASATPTQILAGHLDDRFTPLTISDIHLTAALLRQQEAEIAALRAQVAALTLALADIVNTDWAFLGKDADTGNPASLYCRVQRGRQALAAASPAVQAAQEPK